MLSALAAASQWNVTPDIAYAWIKTGVVKPAGSMKLGQRTQYWFYDDYVSAVAAMIPKSRKIGEKVLTPDIRAAIAALNKRKWKK